VALEFRLRIKKDILKPWILKQVQKYIQKGADIRRKRQDDRLLSEALEDYEQAMVRIIICVLKKISLSSKIASHHAT
jgi:hypothetical protein